MLVVESYFDESGDLASQPKIFCVAGYFIDVSAARAMEAEWKDVLSQYGIPFFHMVDCAHGTGHFENRAVEERSEVARKLIDLIKTYTLEGVSVIAQASTYQGPRKGAPDAYSQCASACARAVQQFIRIHRIEGEIAYFFESGHNSEGTASSYLSQQIKRQGDPLEFAGKEQVCLLQAADILAWQSVKYAKDWFYPRLAGTPVARNPRKDFLSLMEHVHALVHLDTGKANAKGVLGIELFPVSLRSQSATMKIHDDEGPIPFLTEEGSDTPIIPVEGAKRWRLGPSRMPHVEFDGFNGQKIELSFAEPFLFEALTRLVEATGVFEQSKSVPLFSADSVAIYDVEGLKIMHVKLRHGATLAFHLPDMVFEQLRTCFGNREPET